MTYTQWLANEYPALDQQTQAYYRNALLSTFVANQAAPEPVWTNHLAYPMPGFLHLDQLYTSWPDQPNRFTPPSFLPNFEGYLPPHTFCFLNPMGFELHSWTLDVWLGYEDPSEAKLKPRRTYWTGKPRARRNLP